MYENHEDKGWIGGCYNVVDKVTDMIGENVIQGSSSDFSPPTS